MKLRLFVRTDFPDVSMTSGVSSVETELLAHGYLMVRDGDDILGILTPEGVVEKGHRLVMDCMRDVPPLLAELCAWEALEIMQHGDFRAMPVFNDHRFAGVVTRTDLERASSDFQAELEQRVADRTEELIRINEELEKNITERKEAEEEIKNHREHLALINQILRHDLTNDLVVIQSALNLYKDSPEEEFLDKISSHAEKSLELIGRMRELEFFVSSHRRLEVCDMRDTIDEVIINYTFIDFKIKGKARVMADESLNSVIDNIITNAVNHGKADSIAITIDEAMGMCEVRIADNGTGIPDEIKEKVFEEGFIYGDTGHTGLGLHIVEKAMENYGGYAYVEDNKPKGAVFALRFKMVK